MQGAVSTEAGPMRPDEEVVFARARGELSKEARSLFTHLDAAH